MKKLFFSLLMVGLLYGNVYALKFGLEFQAGSQVLVGANFRLSHFIELKPQLGLRFANDNNFFQLNANGNFYFPDLGKLQHYAGFEILISKATNRDTDFGLGGHYGLRYDINEVVSLFGEAGLIFMITPSSSLITNSSGVGVTFYILNR